YVRWNPADAKAALLISVSLGVPAEFHFISSLRPRDFPWIAGAEPFISNFLLPAVPNDLIKNAELVANAVADGRHLDRREGIHVTRGQPAKAAISQSRFFFL